MSEGPEPVDIVFYIEIGGGTGPAGSTGHVGSFGEREHAVSFARLIRRAGYRPRFVVGPFIADHIRLAGFEAEVFRTPDEGIAIVEAIQPAMVIGCELFNLSPDSARGLIATDRPIGTIDGTSLAVPINTDPFERAEYSRTLVLPDRYFSFRPCPVNDIGADTDTVFHWSLFRDVTRVSKNRRLYESLQLDVAKRTILLPVAPWAVGSTYLFGLEDYYQGLVARIVDGLVAAREEVDLAFISLYRPESLTIEQQGSVTVHYPGLLSYDVYDHLLCSCDAIVTDNIISTSVSKAVVMGTPHLIVQNMDANADMAYAWNMFPLKVVFPREREYSQIVESAEYGDVGTIRDALVSLIRTGYRDAEAHRRRQDYLRRLRDLDDPARTLEQIVGRAETVRTSV